MCTSMRLSAHFGQWREVVRRGRTVFQWQVAAELLYGQVKKSSRRRKLVRVSHVMRLGTSEALQVARPRTRLFGAAEHRFYRADESDHQAWNSRAGSSHLGYGSAVPAPARSSRVVASVLSFCATSRIAAGGACAASRTGWQPSGATRPPAYTSHGSRQSQPTMVNAGCPVLSFAASAMLHHVSVNRVRRRPVKWQWATW
jgi:hypothetical protein